MASHWQTPWFSFHTPFPDAKSQHIGKDPDAGKDWKQKGKEAAEDEMVR